MTDRYPVEHGPRKGATTVLIHGNSVANWMWQPQVERLHGRHLLTPDLPGFGTRVDTVWPGMPAAADDIANLIRERAIGRHAHIVGLSLGGFVATHLIQRHPELVRSCTITGVALAGLGRWERRIIAAQIPLWPRRWYWSAQAMAFGIPQDGRALFADTASRVLPETNRRIFREVAGAGMPRGPFSYDGPMLAVAGAREPHSVRDAFSVLHAAVPQLRTWIAPRMHHPWNIQDPDLFTAMITGHTDNDMWPPL